MPEAGVDRDRMMEFENDIFKAKRAIVVAIILIIFFAGLFAAGFFLRDRVWKETTTEPIEYLTEFTASFYIGTFSTPVVVEIIKEYPSDICVIDRDLYDQAASSSEVLLWALKAERDATHFIFDEKLGTGEYIIFIGTCQFDDLVEIKLTRLVLKPIILWVGLVLGLLCLLLVLRIGLKIRRIKIIKRNRDEYLVHASKKPEPSKFGWGGDRGPPPGEVPIYEASYRQPAPSYSSSDLAYFSDLDDGSSTGSGSSSGAFLEFGKPGETGSSAPPRRASRGDISTGRPPRPAFKKKDKYGFKGGGRRLQEDRPARERPSKDRDVERRGREKERTKRPDRPKKKGSGDGYLDFDDFD